MTAVKMSTVQIIRYNLETYVSKLAGFCVYQFTLWKLEIAVKTQVGIRQA